MALPLSLIALLALCLRALEAAEASLWLDELHTLSHASQPTLGALLASVASEFHTPLFFAGVHLFGGFEQGAWLRAIPILSSVAMLWPLVAIARAAGLGRAAILGAAWLYACLPYQVLYGSELRPYVWVGWFAAMAFYVAFSERRASPVRLAAFLVLILLGLLTHRIMALALVAIGCARLFARPPGAVPLLGLIAAGAIAVGGFLPWLWSFAKTATDLRFDYQASVGGYRLRPALVSELASLPSRLATPYMRELGGPWAVLMLAASAVFALAVAILLLLAWRAGPRATRSPVLRGLWIFALAQFTLTTAFAVYTWDRAPLQYYAAMAWCIPLLLAACWERVESPAARRGLAVSLGAASLVMAVGLVGGKSREDMRGGIAAVRSLASEARAQSGMEPVYTALLAQPAQFEHRLPYRAYAPDLTALEPADVPRVGEADFARPLIVLRRVVPLRHAEWLPITGGRKLVREVAVDRYLTAYWFAPQ